MITETDSVTTTNQDTSGMEKWKLTSATLIVCLGSMAVGLTGGYPSPAVPDINSNPNPFHVDIDSQSWFSSVGYLGAILGSLVSGTLVDVFGRKLTLMIATVPFLLGWITIAAAENTWMIYIGRLHTGMSCPIIMVSANIYVSEISPANVRALLVSLNQMFMQLGVLSSYVAGTFIHWNWLTIVCAAPSVLMTLLLAFLPETPRWLLMKGRTDEAIKALNWFRHNEIKVTSEIQDIQRSLREAAQKQVLLKDYLHQPLNKLLGISLALFVFQEFSGINVVRAYTVTIFQSARNTLNPNLETIVVGSMLVFGSIMATLVIDRFTRRTLLMASCFSMTIGMASMGAYFFVEQTLQTFTLQYLYWLPVTAFAIYTISFTIGCGPLPHVISNELFPTRARGRAYGFGIAADYLLGFLTTKCFPYIRIFIGDYGTFWMLSCISFLGTMFVHFFLPETKGRSLEQLEQEFHGPSQNDGTVNSD